MSPLLDTHYHFDFLAEPELRAEFLAALAERDVRIVTQTLLPSSFLELMGQVPNLAALGLPLPRWSVGFHPWYIEDGTHADAELALLPEALARTRFVGEIGLDYAPRRLAEVPAPLQRRVFEQLVEHVCRAASEATSDEPYVLSIHTVRSASDAIEILKGLDAVRRNVVPVFHRFNGTSDELTALIRLGCYVSVHPLMLETKRGRAYATQVPAGRLLLESDLPTGAVAAAASGSMTGPGSAAGPVSAAESSPEAAGISNLAAGAGAPRSAPQATDRQAGARQPATHQTAATLASELADELADSLNGTLDALSRVRRGNVAATIAQTSARLYGAG